jgi:opacity protein-like surface antigen
MKKLVLTAVAAAIVGTAPFAAIAGGVDQAPSAQQGPQGGLVVGLGIGWGRMEMPKNAVTDQYLKNNAVKYMTHAQSNFAARVHLGYLFKAGDRFLVGPEVGYNYLGDTKYTYTDDTYKANYAKASDYSFDLLGVGKYYVTQNLDLFGKAGIAVITQKATFEGTPVAKGKVLSYTNNKTKVLPEVAAGVGYDVTKNIETTVTYAHAFGQDLSSVQKSQQATFGNDIPSYNTVLVGVDYTFNL